MGAESKSKKTQSGVLKIMLFIILIMSFSIFVKSISFPISPAITNGGVIDTFTDLTCSWEASGDTTETNVSWYNGSTLFSSETVAVNTSILDDQYTAKNELWTCEVIISNGTDTDAGNASVNINNSYPLVPNLLYLGSPITDNYNLIEDTVYYFVINSSDPDGDELEYSITTSGGICAVLDSATGNTSCTADHADLTGSSSPAPENSINKTIRMRADEANIDPSAGQGKYFNFTLIPFNDQAYFTASLSNKSVNASVSWSVSVSAEDEETNYPINFTLWSDLNDDDCPANVTVTNTSNKTANITFNAATDNSCAGNWTIMVNVTDTSGYNASRNSSQMTFGLQINITNYLPAFTTNFTNLSTQSWTQGSNISILLNANDSNAGDNLTFSITQPTSAALRCNITFPWAVTTTNASYLNASGLINITSLTNDYVACRYVNFVVSDQVGGTATQSNFLINITNTNDAPIIYTIGLDGNISNKSVRLYQSFSYRVNASDPDSYTYDYANTGILTYYSNDSRFPINSGTGLISATPNNESYVGIFAVLITVSDGYINDTEVMNIQVVNNSVPVINLSNNNFEISQNNLSTINFSATEPDNETMTLTAESLTSFSDSTYNAYFNLSSNSYAGGVNLEYWKLNLSKSSARERNDLVGNHRINILFEDAMNASIENTSSGILNFTVTNENDAPFFDMDQNNISDNVSFSGKKSVNLPYSITLKATDYDIFLGDVDNESLIFECEPNANFSSINLTRYNDEPNMFTLSFTPAINGTQYLTINVTDIDGLSETQIVEFEVLSNTSEPEFQRIRPYYNSTTNLTVMSFINASQYPGKSVSLNISENTTVIFDADVTNDTSIEGNNLTFNWYVNDELVSAVYPAVPAVDSNYTEYFDFFSNGTYTIVLETEDERGSTANWTWHMNVSNVNRPPVYCAETLEDLVPPEWEINSTYDVVDGYLTLMAGTQRFYDPDDDPINTGENNYNCSNYYDNGAMYFDSLTFALVDPDSCSLADFTFNNRSSFVIVPSGEGACILNFTATDEFGANVTSDEVLVQFTGAESNEGNEDVVQRSGGGSSSTQIITVPIQEEVDKPVPIKIIAPGAVSTYANKTIYIPLKIKNTWTAEVRGVELSGVALNATLVGEENVNVKFSQTYFPIIPVGGESETVLEISNYRKEGPFEVVVYAKVAEPEFTDSTSIFISSLEQSSAGDNVKSKVTFAKDMLSENPVCRELNELLDRAENEAAAENFDEAMNLVDGVINGCKFLTNQEESRRETPSIIKQGLDLSRKYAVDILIGSAVLLVVTLLFYSLAALRRKIIEK
ncbi:MAG: hypothetical protein ACP5N3_06585 [Candidatus Nanoarchaeia archaeon]